MTVGELRRVDLHWRLAGESVALQWREIGGPRAPIPAASGFGAFLLGRMLAADLGDPAEMIQAPEGPICAPVAGAREGVVRLN